MARRCMLSAVGDSAAIGAQGAVLRDKILNSLVHACLAGMEASDRKCVEIDSRLTFLANR